MSADANIKTIAEVYQAFGRGDVAAIIDTVTDDVDWAAEAASSAAPWYGVRHGKDAVAAFFSEPAARYGPNLRSADRSASANA